jgi:hypothetical protein
VVTETEGSNKRALLAALIAVKAGQRPRLFYRGIEADANVSP